MGMPQRGISTSWIGDVPRSADDIIKRIDALDGIDGVEINYRITQEAFNKVTKAVRKADMKIFSLHNYTPIPPDIPFSKASGDLYNLASIDADERKLAVKYTAKTIEFAHELEGPVVILHCGKVNMEAGWDKIRKWVGEGMPETGEAAFFIKQKLGERRNLSGPFFDALLLSLDELANLAQKYSVTLGIENRYSFHEIPQEEEFVTIFNEFRGAPLVYWHDTGHFHVSMALKTIREEIWFNEVFPHVGGCHIHDVKGVDDHLAIGEGSCDFSDIRRLLEFNPEIPLILELKPGLEDQKVQESLENFEKIITSWNKQENQGE